jgi:PAS domain S-box-containing protein
MPGYSSFEELAASNLNIETSHREYARTRFQELAERPGGVAGLESKWRRRDGSIIYILENARVVRDDSGKVLYYEGTVEDITPYKEAQHRQDLTVQVLDILNRAGSLSGMIGEILQVVRQYGGYDAVGIRLREGEDFPYFVQEGFSKGFVERENYLCSRTPEGDLRSDEQGQPILECTCGLVLGGRSDPANPLFTTGGSFWTNRSSHLLELSAQEDPRRYPRNRCISEGYESVALIPIRVGEEIVGLLQLNDRRPGRFTVDAIHFFEGIGASIGLALARQREAEALRQSEQFNREVISNAQEGVVVYDREFRILLWNRFMEELTGMPAAQVLGKNAFDLFPHLREQNVEPLARRALAGETLQSQDVPFLVRETAKSGWVYGTYSPHFGPHGEIIGVVAIVRETTKRKQAEEELRQTSEVLRAIVQASPLAIIASDRSMNITAWNAAAERLFGWSEAEVLGKPTPIVPESRREEMRARLEAVVQGEKEAPYETQRLRKDGSLLDVSVWNVALRGASGEIVGFMAIMADVTELKRAREESQRSLEQLRALAAHLQTIREEERTSVAREIHDQLGQALTAIKLDLSSLARKLPSDREQRSKRTASILKLVDETIRSVRRISTELRPGMLDDLGLVATVEWAAEEFATRTGTKCRLDLPQESIAIDPQTATAVFRILQETLTNVARHANASEVNVRLAKQDGDLTLEVYDNGRGITEGEISSAGSLGILGMRERALLLGGEVTVRGAPGKGTTVRVRVPAAYRAEREQCHD